MQDPFIYWAMLRATLRLTSLPLALVLTACAALGAPLGVTASFTIPADIAREVGGDTVTVRSLTPPNSDLHAIQPTPAQVRALGEADLVVAIHPELEVWIAQLERAGTLKRPVLYLAKDLLGKTLAHHRHDHDDHDGHDHANDHTGDDPHVWMDPELAGKMAVTLAERLAALDPKNAARHRAAGTAYAARMKALADGISKTLAPIPEARRVLLSQHDNLGRFAKKFRLREAGTLLDGASTEASDPSAKRIAGLITRIRAEKIPAIFTDNTLSPDLPATVAREAGLPPPVTLYIDALDKPGTPAGSYEGMMRENARRIAGALTPAEKLETTKR